MSYNILTVEDDQDALANLRDILELDGYCVTGASTLKEVTDRHPWSEFSVILLDQQLPDGITDTILPQIRETAPHAAGIVITGHADLNGTIAAMRSGAADYLLEPINPDLLCAAIARVLKMQEMEERTLQAERLAAIGDLLQTAPDVILRIDTDGRIRLMNAEAERIFGYREEAASPDVPKLFASYNVAPAQQILALRIQDDAKVAVALRWGLIPSWAKDKKSPFINARGETVADKPAFRAAFKKRRCLIVADGYYEWKKLDAKAKQPYFFRLKNGDPLEGDARRDLPPYVTLVDETNLPFGQDPAYLGPAHRPFAIRGPGMANLTLAPGMNLDRLADRSTLLRQFDSLNRAVDSRREMAGMDAFTARALEIVTSSKTRDAFDVRREPLAVREMYGANPASTHFLRARRLVEAGVKVVTLCGGWVVNGQSPSNLSNWDTHDDNFPRLREQLPPLDRALSALVTDLHQRGLDQDVTVVACGEMGRAPRIGVPNPGSNASASGRDHWPTGFCWISGGGLNMGKIVGATDARGERSAARPITAQHLLATLYRVLGISLDTTLVDHAGRPQFLLDAPSPIEELL